MVEGEQPTPLDHALREARQGLLVVAVLSLFLNLLALTSPLYMFQVFDRVLPSGHVETLVALTVLAGFALLVFGLLETIRHQALVRVGGGHHDAPAEPLKPAIAVKRSVTSDFIVCLEDGKKFKSLKRHLRTHYDMTPEQYREKWGLPPDYPMVAPNYAAARSQLAKQMGLGQQRRRRR